MQQQLRNWLIRLLFIWLSIEMWLGTEYNRLKKQKKPLHWFNLDCDNQTKQFLAAAAAAAAVVVVVIGAAAAVVVN